MGPNTPAKLHVKPSCLPVPSSVVADSFFRRFVPCTMDSRSRVFVPPGTITRRIRYAIATYRDTTHHVATAIICMQWVFIVDGQNLHYYFNWYKLWYIINLDWCWTPWWLDPLHGLGDLTANPQEDLPPRMAWIELRRREKSRRHRNQQRVELYGESHFCDSIEARRL